MDRPGLRLAATYNQETAGVRKAMQPRSLLRLFVALRYRDEGGIVAATKRHAAVFLAALALAVGVAVVLPLSVNKKDVFFYFMIAFMAYLAGSYLWAAFGSGRGERK
jgi:hypothetical protein